MRNLFNLWRHDLSLGLVVFVALPFCLNVGLASANHRSDAKHACSLRKHLNQGSAQLTLHNLPKNSLFTIDGTNCQSNDNNVLEILHEYKDFEANEKT